MIEDRELRDLFKAESEEHLSNLERGVLALEKTPGDSPIMEEAFRDAHSLKGAARMVGVKDIELIAHRVEDILGAVKKGEKEFFPGLADRIYGAIDAVRSLVKEATTGEKAGVVVTDIIRLLDTGEKGAVVRGGAEPPADRGAIGAGPSEAGVSRAAPTGDPSEGAGAADGEGLKDRLHAHGGYRIDTIRIETKKLDELMTGAGELAVMRTRLSQRLSEADTLFDSWEELSKRLRRAVSTDGRLSEGLQAFSSGLERLRSSLYDDEARLSSISGSMGESIGEARLLPLSTLFNLFPRMIRDLARERGKEVRFLVEGNDVRADKRVIEEMKDPLMHTIRNSIDHGIEGAVERERAGKPATGTVSLSALRNESNIVIEVSDDGRGLDEEAVKRAALKMGLVAEQEVQAMTQAEARSLIFAPGLTTSWAVTETSGRGVGLDIVRVNVERLKGAVRVESEPGKGMRTIITLPVALATARVIIALLNGRKYAIPVESVHSSRVLRPGEVFPVEGRESALLDGVPVTVARLSAVLGLDEDGPGSEKGKDKEGLACVFMQSNDERFGVVVDGLLDEEEVVLKPQSALLKRVRNVSGATILGGGEVAMVLNPADMLKTLKKPGAAAHPSAPGPRAKGRKKSVLLVEDSITTRTQEKRILEGGGYEVTTAVDGLDALQKLSSRSFDAVVSDIMMPNMDGLALTARIRQDKRLNELPIILVTTLSSEDDRKRGLDAGANAYLAKPAFDQKVFLETLGRLV
ncbi:MAG: hybrid sensor histidine kinase/response regulator [Deltaproteobacteria bacterium]|nr:hybrid sensor histidine kinase/response regulator [Deltaproteobacteria bacterium]